MNKNLDKEKELLRQGELRATGILEFSKEIDSKIFKLLGSSIAISFGLLFFLLKDYESLSDTTKLISWSIITILIISTSLLIRAGKPNSYKGVGLPLNMFKNSSYEQILNESKNHYKDVFANNRDLNKEKVKWLNNAILLLSYSPLLLIAIWLLRSKIFYILDFLF